MLKKFIFVMLIIAAPQLAKAEIMKKADLAGKWYPGSKAALSAALDRDLAAAKVAAIEGEIKAVIAPHAGLIYSGGVAAHAYKAVGDKRYSSIIILGFCHRKHFDGISVYNEGYFETPLGPIEVDSILADEIISRHKKIIFEPSAFNNENSIELELPFIKKVFPDAKIVPIAFGSSDFKYCKFMADVLSDILDDRPDVLLVASADMSHYREYDDAVNVDMKTLELLRGFDAKGIYDISIMSEQLFCGYMPVATTLLACESMGANKVSVLKYANSGDVTGDKKRVVGYVSAVIYRETEGQKGDRMLNDDQRKRLLGIARDTIRTYLELGKILSIEDDDPLFNKELGAFVTLHKGGQLRGCIGNIIGRGPLYLTVRDMAIQSATGDTRFSKVKLAELDEIDIEISVLSELEKVPDASGIEMGKHGVLVRKGSSSGVYLPQVAAETGWSKEEFMNSLCSQKAGLMPDAWKTGEADIYVFTAEVFSEKDE